MVSVAKESYPPRTTHILYPAGTMLLAMMATAIMITHDTIQISQNRFHIAGHSLKKCESCVV